MSHNISDELYNQILHTNSPNELWNLKNLIINSQNNDDISNSSSDIISIRVLSQKEFNKYIRDGVAGGSITPKNVNVYHFDNHVFTYRQKITGWYSTPDLLAAPVIVLVEAAENNHNANACFSHIAGVYEMQLWEMNPSSNDYFMYNQTLDYSKTNTHLNTARHAYYGNWPDMVYQKSAFRPVFQYIDNSKSNNVYY